MQSESHLKSILKSNFGYENFRPNQLEIIQSILNGKDTLAIMPTGGGKSICYQLPAIVLKGLTIVISPLIALMKDQVDALKANGIPAAFINSSQNQNEIDDVFVEINEGRLRLLYIAPESLSLVEGVLLSGKIKLIAVDEAHCISSWGHDFRPAYTTLGFLKKKLPDVPMIALTATADKATREDIVTQLELYKPNRFISSFDRKNLYLDVRPGKERVKQIMRFLETRRNESGIIYCLSRKSTEDLSRKLNDAGFSAQHYHAGLDAETRSKVQEDFIMDRSNIICATIAFGMGIDKSNVRWVIHYNLPKNIEGYYQEIGRAGRDSLPSDTLLFYSYADVVQLRQFAENSNNGEVQLAKLQRMQQFAESLNCRRRALLSYFGETLAEDCGNCDNCKQPPELLDGTVVSQKALSAIYRLKESESMNNVINFLRGSQNSYLLAKGYHEIKTFGVGRDISFEDWQQYLIQLLNQGYCEIAFHEQNRIKLTNLADKVLFEGQKVTLAKIVEISKKSKQVKVKIETIDFDKDLFEVLRQLRMRISKSEKVPPYVVFSDVALKEMAETLPQTESEFLAINGVGKVKLKKYGSRFMDAIASYK